MMARFPVVSRSLPECRIAGISFSRSPECDRPGAHLPSPGAASEERHLVLAGREGQHGVGEWWRKVHCAQSRIARGPVRRADRGSRRVAPSVGHVDCPRWHRQLRLALRRAADDRAGGLGGGRAGRRPRLPVFLVPPQANDWQPPLQGAWITALLRAHDHNELAVPPEAIRMADDTGMGSTGGKREQHIRSSNLCASRATRMC